MSDRQYNNELRGVLFTNERRENESQPHYQGHCEIQSVPYWLSAWIKQPANGGNDYVSLSFRRKDAPRDAPKPAKDDPNLRGALFINERKDSDEKPDYTGRCQVDDVRYWLNAHIKAPRDPGDDFISIQFEVATGTGARSTGRLDARALLAQTRARAPVAKSAMTRDDYDQLPPADNKDFDDDIPF